MKKLILAIFLVTFGLSAHARNPGDSAQHCIDTSASNGKVTFTNICLEKVFVVWCGDLTNSKKRCGDGSKGGFYTQSANLGPKQNYTTAINGQYQYAACKGSTSIGAEGDYQDSPNGTVRCLKH